MHNAEPDHWLKVNDSLWLVCRSSVGEWAGRERIPNTFVAEKGREREREEVCRDQPGRAHLEPRLQKHGPPASSSKRGSLRTD